MVEYAILLNEYEENSDIMSSYSRITLVAHTESVVLLKVNVIINERTLQDAPAESAKLRGSSLPKR